jgi:putative membrane protein
MNSGKTHNGDHFIRRTTMQVFLIISLVIAVLAIIFALQNTAVASVTFIVWTFTGSLALVLLVALVAGILISFLASLPTLIRDRLTISRQNKKLAELESSLAEFQQKINALQKEPESTAETPPDQGN